VEIATAMPTDSTHESTTFEAWNGCKTGSDALDALLLCSCTQGIPMHFEGGDPPGNKDGESATTWC